MVSYQKLLAVLKNRNIAKTKMATDIGISSDTLAKLSKNEPVKMDVLERICNYLGLTPNDVMDIINEYKQTPLLNRLLEEKKYQIKGGIYHETQVIMTYNSNHIEGSKLSEDQTRYIFETSTLINDKETGILVDDVIETVNHFACINYVLDHIYEPISESLIKQLHKILKTGTKDSNLEWFNIGEYKSRANVVGGKKTTTPSEVASEIQSLIGKYVIKRNITFEDVIDFHYNFEAIHPFQDGNGRVGRLITFKECLKYGLVPFIIDEEIKAFYYRGLKEYENERGHLIDTCYTGQDKYRLIMKCFDM